jgi:hypothetical protein
MILICYTIALALTAYFVIELRQLGTIVKIKPMFADLSKYWNYNTAKAVNGW